MRHLKTKQFLEGEKQRKRWPNRHLLQALYHSCDEQSIACRGALWVMYACAYAVEACSGHVRNSLGRFAMATQRKSIPAFRGSGKLCSQIEYCAYVQHLCFSISIGAISNLAPWVFYNLE